MQITYTFDELKKKYLAAAETWEDMPETKAEYEKACAELAKLVPDAELREKIKDCFGLCFDKHQMQGFINGYTYSLQTFSKESQGELPKDKAQITPHQRISKCAELSAKADILKELCSKVYLIYGDMFEELHEDAPRIDVLRTRLDIMSDYIAKLMSNTKTLSELVEVVYQSVGGQYVD